MSAPIPVEVFEARIERKMRELWSLLNDLGGHTHEALARFHLELEGLRAEVRKTPEQRERERAEREAAEARRHERGAKGGRARAAGAIRTADGRFISNADAEMIERQREAALYERHAKGGRARAAGAMRDIFGQFAAATPAPEEKPL